MEASHYDIKSYDFLKGFISGLYAGNYDITHVFIDSLTKIVGGECDNETEKFLDWLNSFSEKNNISSPSPSAPMPPWPPTASRNTSDTCPFSGPCRPAGPAASFLPPSGVKSLVHPAYRRRTLDNIPIAWDYLP